MNELILGNRRSGKTKELIERCSKDNYSIIVCPNRAMCKITVDMANDMDKPIPMPITFEEFCLQRYMGRIINKFYFDELQMSLSRAAQFVPIGAAVIDTSITEVVNLNNPEPHTTVEHAIYKYKNKYKVFVDYDEYGRALISKSILEALLRNGGWKRE